MFKFYYDLADPKRLPVGTYYVDPQDGVRYIVNPRETLDNFIARILAGKERAGHHELDARELRMLVVISLSQTASERDLQKFFVRKATVASVSQVVSAATSIAYQALSGTSPSYNKRQERVSKCKKCPYHSARGFMSNMANKVLGAPLSLAKLNESPEEAKLGTCSLCGGCSLQKKVKYDIKSVLVSTDPSELAAGYRRLGGRILEDCWIYHDSLERPDTKPLFLRKMAAGGVSAEIVNSVHAATMQAKRRHAQASK